MKAFRKANPKGGKTKEARRVEAALKQKLKDAEL